MPLSQYVPAALAGMRRMPFTLMLSAALVLSYFTPRGHDDQRALQIALLLAAGVLALAALLRDKLRVAAAAPGWCLPAFFALGALSGARAWSPAHAGHEVASFLLLLVLGAAVADEMRRHRASGLLLVLRICGWGCLLYAARIVPAYLAALVSGLQPEVLDFCPGFSNQRFLNHAQTLTLPLLVLLYLLDRPAGAGRPVWFALAAFWWTLLLVLSGRGTFVGVLAGIIVAYALRRRHAHALCRAMALTALLGVALYAVLFVALPLARGMDSFGELARVVQRSVDQPTSSRTLLWARAWDLIVAHPWLGVGPQHLAHDSAALRWPAHPHNWVVQIGAEWGLPALLCLGLALAAAARGLLRAGRVVGADEHANQAILAAWILIGVALLVDGLFSGLIVMPVSQLLIVLYGGCAAGWVRSLGGAGATAPARPGAARRGLGAAVLLASMAALVLGAWSGLPAALRFEAAPLAPPQGNIYNPRLWLEGNF